MVWYDSGYPVHKSVMMETKINFSFLECNGYSLVHKYQLSGGTCLICLHSGRVKRSLNVESAGNISAFLPNCVVLYRKVLSDSLTHNCKNRKYCTKTNLVSNTLGMMKLFEECITCSCYGSFKS